MEREQLIEAFNIAKQQQNQREHVKVWIDGNKYIANSAEDLIEQYERYIAFRTRVENMKTYADYLGGKNNV